MQIELYKAGKLSQKGSSLRSMIMNKDMPILDLLVRESIQNSLDAKDDVKTHPFVSVEFTIGDFQRSILDQELDGISLANKPFLGNRFLSIRDHNTVGLTGQYNDKKSNLYKLVYGIMEAQSASGAGGSWGIGKTVYFRVGIGLVLYYSRTKNSSGSFSSLLAAALVEDETQKNSLLPSIDGDKFGIAWWGERVNYSSNEVRETRNEATIDRLLRAFNLQPFTKDSTGTIIIIPFINEASLLSNNRPKLEEGQNAPFWTNSVSDYIEIAVQKWYSARLSNKKYCHGKYLNVKINGKALDPSSMEPLFKLTQVLYNKAALSIKRDTDANKVQFLDAEIHCEKIIIYSEITPNEAGQVAFTKVNRKQLGMLPPENGPSPFEYINESCDSESFGKPIVLFCRKPGMTVSYETDGKWAAGIELTSEDEFIVAYFVLNSNSKLTVSPDDTSLEDYARKSELADHTSWEDCDINGVKPSIIKKIRANTSRKIANSYKSQEKDLEKVENTGLSTLLGRILLPPDGFGQKANDPPIDEKKGATTSVKNTHYSYAIDNYTSQGMALSIHVTTAKKKARGFGIEIKMDSASGPISGPVWEKEVGLELPFFFKEVNLEIIKVDGTKKGIRYEISQYDKGRVDNILFYNKLTSNGNWFAIAFSFEDGLDHSFEIDLKIDTNIRRKDIKPILTFE